MAMDFFERQDKARSKTMLLVIYFCLTILLFTGAIYALLVFFMGKNAPHYDGTNGLDWGNLTLFLWTLVSITLVVGLGSVFKISALRSGGGAVARSLGGRKLETFSQEPAHQRLLNVVEEMAIASGTPVPEVYLLPESGINAFAAGFTPDDAAIAVTEGCLHSLSRDELQGVIAHEFSHILNGDMRMNIRLMGVIFGILVVAVIGRILMQASAQSSMYRRSSRDKDNSAMFFIVLGLALFAVGQIGVLFARLIQSAISRQREFLADASAVQFTRNPDGIAGALKRIGGISEHSIVKNPHAEECAHLFFASGLRSGLGGAFATHPPLDSRIRAIQPSWDGEFLTTPYAWTDSVSTPRRDTSAHGSSDNRKTDRSSRAPTAAATPPKLDPLTMVLTAGVLSEGALKQAQATRASLDADFATVRRNPMEARCLLYALVLDTAPEHRSQQLGYLQTEAGEDIANTTRELYPRVQKRDRADYLPMIELALPTLDQLAPDTATDFQQRLRRLVEMDDKVTMFEFVVTRLVRKHFERRAQKNVDPGSYIWSASALAESLSQVLSAIVYLNTEDTKVAQQAFEQAAQNATTFKKHLAFVSSEHLNYANLDAALDKLARGSFGLRKQTLNVCAYAIRQDGVTTSAEAELLRAIGLSLDCPIPPSVTAQS